jgi:hypothetical protein
VPIMCTVQQTTRLGPNGSARAHATPHAHRMFRVGSGSDSTATLGMARPLSVTRAIRLSVGRYHKRPLPPRRADPSDVPLPSILSVSMAALLRPAQAPSGEVLSKPLAVEPHNRRAASRPHAAAAVEPPAPLPLRRHARKRVESILSFDFLTFSQIVLTNVVPRKRPGGTAMRHVQYASAMR